MRYAHVSLFDLISLLCCSQGPLPSAIKVRGGSPYAQYEILGSDGLGIPPQGPADNWHRTPGSKMGNKPATSSWPPGYCLYLLYAPKRLSVIRNTYMCQVTQYLLYMSQKLLFSVKIKKNA